MLWLLSLSEGEKYLDIPARDILGQTADRQDVDGGPSYTAAMIRAVNTTLPYKKVLHIHRGCPNKYHSPP